VDAALERDALKILQVSTRDVAGGAERSARNLADEYRRLGHDSWLAVGDKRTDDAYTFAIANDARRNAAVRAVDAVRRIPMVHRIRGMGRLTSMLRRAAEPSRMLDRERGREDFSFPGTAGLLDLPPSRPDILHLHNLHGDYFDLRELPALSRQVPTILNLRDAWLMSGHCAFSLDCERWKTGCGDCPDLTLFPAIKRDATSFNWHRKQSILSSSRYYVATASEWMMSRVRESIVAAGAIDFAVIPNGVDTNTFRPGNRAEARHRLGLEADAHILLVAANGLRHNVWKDYRTLRAALAIVGARPRSRQTIVLAVGEPEGREQVGSLELRFVPFQSDSERLADHYRAADLYLHAARVESFGNVLLEARACGTAIVSTAIGGIPEQVPESTGVLVPPSDAVAFAAAVNQLLDDDALRDTIAANGLRHVQSAFTLRLQAERFLTWYREIRAREVHHRSA
jgi:glycosyltransferase involved in cell wall biosynthesis